MSTPKTVSTWLLGVLLGSAVANAAAQSLGNLAQYPATPRQLKITTSNEGYPVIEPSVIELDLSLIHISEPTRPY